MESIIPVSDPTLTKLLLCLNLDGDQSLPPGWDQETWQEILRLGQHFSVNPLLYRHLIRNKPGLKLPPAIYEEIRTAYYRTLAENSLRYNTLAEALAVLKGTGIPVLLLKGAHLAEQIYGDIGLRPMADFDLLVPRPDLQQALKTLERVGFVPGRVYFEEADGALHFHAPGMEKKGTALEIHWDLTAPDGPLKADIDGLWRRAVPLELQDGQALALSPPDLLVYLCVHASYGHAFYNQLRSLCDIREMLAVQGEKLDWKAFVSAVDSWNATKGVYLALRLAKELLKAEIPGQVLEALEPPGFEPRALVWAQTQLFRQTPPLSANFKRVMLQGTPSARLRALWTGLFPVPAVMSQVYGISPGSWRLALLYPYNAVTRLARYAKPALELLNRKSLRLQDADSGLNLLDWLGIKG